MGEVKNKKVSTEEISFTEDITLVDNDVEKPINITNLVKEEISEEKQTKTEGSKLKEREDSLINCLRNEVITVRYIRKEKSKNLAPDHVMYGGLHEKAKNSYCVPLQRNGQLVNVLTSDEKDYLEYIMGMDHNDLSVLKRKDNFWANRWVILGKEDTYLNLSMPADYISYKILLANPDFICPSLQDYKDKPKATYRYMLISANEEIKSTNENMTISMKASFLLGQLMNEPNSKEILRFLIEMIDGRPVDKNSKIDFIHAQVFKVMQGNSKLFINLAEDKLLKTKVFIRECVDYGLIKRRNGFHYLANDNTPLAEGNNDPILSNAALYITSPKRQEVKFSLEAKLNQLKE